jgi:rubrerythrin
MRIGRLRGWRARLRALTRAERLHVRDILGAHYTAKIRAARRFAEDADRLGRYPDRRERLLEIAAREENHARWLRQTIQRLGGRVPERVPSPPAARTTWERLVSDLEAEKDTLETLVDDAYAVQRDYPDVAALLLRIREEDTAHEREIASIIGRSDRAVLDRPSLDVLARRALAVADRTYAFWSLRAVEGHLGVSLDRLPFCIRVLLENLVRRGSSQAQELPRRGLGNYSRDGPLGVRCRHGRSVSTRPCRAPARRPG